MEIVGRDSALNHWFIVVGSGGLNRGAGGEVVISKESRDTLCRARRGTESGHHAPRIIEFGETVSSAMLPASGASCSPSGALVSTLGRPCSTRTLSSTS